MNIQLLQVLIIIFVVVGFLLIDVTIIGGSLLDLKHQEQFAEPPSKTPYTNMTAATLVCQEDKIRSVSATNTTAQCQDSCTYDDKCVGFVFDSVKPKCQLMYDIDGFVRNRDGLFTVTSGIKLRDFIGQNQPDKKFLRYEGMEMPPGGTGKLATHQFIKSVHDCKNKCLEHNDPNGKCMAFEYDFANKACTLNKEISGKLSLKPSKDTYIIIN